MIYYLQDDPIQGILFNAKSTIKFRDPLNRREKKLAGIKKIKTIKPSKNKPYTPTFKTDLMPSKQEIASVVPEGQFRGSTTLVTLD